RPEFALGVYRWRLEHTKDWVDKRLKVESF
ncbi:unnamed protein product, partial [marine sediment metagenome]